MVFVIAVLKFASCANFIVTRMPEGFHRGNMALQHLINHLYSPIVEYFNTLSE